MTARHAATQRARYAPHTLATRPRVSVVIPCFRYERYVAEAVGSALAQDHVEVEVIVVDDASPDRSAAVVREIAATDARVRLIENAVNRGAVETFNTGLAEVTGAYVVRLDADDALTPGSLARAVALAEAHPSVGLVYGHPLHFDADRSRPPARTRPTRWTVWPGREWLRARCATGLNVITSPEVVMRREVVDAVGGQRPLAHTHDMEMWLRIAAVSDVGYVEGADQAWHREHAGSLSQTVDADLGDIVDRWDAFRTLFAWSRDVLPETDALERVAARAFAAEAIDRIVHMYDRGRFQPEVAERLRAFADSVSDTPATTAALERAAGRGPHARPLPWQVARAAYRRVASDVRYRRWHRYGVFHRDGQVG
ncbi:glycosyltransferase family 2 protein [Microbacterium sp. 10M-3C3]|uniref:glycosyltransferase family 2 protein n=1 Tax=Microbacterium sp. 10M-3C3 TaxID=2483401 RepID=UPI000F6414D6|nr:glycosyltransferase family 2 protein [Microbacterium sp. 10M-3C3]